MSVLSFTVSKVNVPFLVTGANGKLGRAVINHLLDTLQVEPKDIIAGTRNPDQLEDLTAREVQVRRLDFEDTASIELAANGVKRVLLISLPSVENAIELYRGTIDALVRAGAQHILYTSYHDHDKSLAPIAKVFSAAEQLIRDSGVSGYTMLRNGMYFENQVGFLKHAIHTGKWLTAAKDGKLSSIARHDLALATAVALATNNDNSARQVYNLTGQKAQTIDEFVSEMVAVVGKPIDVVHVSEKELAEFLSSWGVLPPRIVVDLVSFDVNTAAGFAGSVSDDFQKITGREPQLHANWLQANKSMLPIAE